MQTHGSKAAQCTTYTYIISTVYLPANRFIDAKFMLQACHNVDDNKTLIDKKQTSVCKLKKH